MDDAYVVVYRGDGMEELSYVERADLWAAIEDLLTEATSPDHFYEVDPVAYRAARTRVRELLGMEPES